MYKVSLLFVFLLACTNYANADVVYNFEGQCDGGCTGTATGVLTLNDSYIPGAVVTDADFISLTYQSSTGSFVFDASILNRFINGRLPLISGPSLEWVEIDAINNNTGLQACAVTGTPTAGLCPSDNFWAVEWGPSGISQDFGSSYTWTRQPCAAAICDNTDVGFSYAGDWGTSSFSPGFFGSNYLHDRNNMKSAKTTSWLYEISENGDVEISARWASHPNRATSVQYMYAVNGGSIETCGVPQDQRINGGQFNTLCTATGLIAGQTLTVLLTNDDPSGYVIADAVQVGPVGSVPPIAAFTASQIFNSLTFEFDASDSNDPDGGSIVNYDWDFGDGSGTGTGETPFYDYASAGSYDVSLTVTDDEGDMNTVTQAVTVQPTGAPAICPSSICDNTDTGFNTVGDWGTSSFSPGFFGSNYLHDRNNMKSAKTASWNYEIAADGNVSIAAQWTSNSNRATAVQYMYSVGGAAAQACGAPQDQRINGGQFNTLCTVTGLTVGPRLTVILTNNDPSGYVIADAVQVVTAGIAPPVAEFTTSEDPETLTLTVDFDASGSYDPDGGSIVSYEWDFDYADEGICQFAECTATGSGVTPSFTYCIPNANNPNGFGFHSVSLTVTDDEGDTNQIIKQVEAQFPSNVDNTCLTGYCDNTDPGFNAVGDWGASSFSSGFVGSNYLHDRNSGKGTKTASWTFLITPTTLGTVAGRVTPTWAPHPNRATNVQYMYSVDGGTLQACGPPVDQRVSPNFNPSLCFTPGDPAYPVSGLCYGRIYTISLTNDDPSGYVIADAIDIEDEP